MSASTSSSSSTIALTSSSTAILTTNSLSSSSSETINFISTVPTDLTYYSARIAFRSQEEKNQIIESLAERISSIYAAFLTADWHTKRGEYLKFCGIPEIFPPMEKVEKFKVNLKNTIIAESNQGNEDYDKIYLSTEGAGPEKLLLTVLDESSVCSISYKIHYLFPIKTSTRIYIQNKFQRIEIMMTPSNSSF